MMKRIATVAVGVMIMAGLTAAAQTDVDVTGTWNAVVDLDVGSGEPVFIFAQDGETLTGTYQGTFGNASITGTVKGDMIEFTFGAEGVGEAKYSGRITPDAVGSTIEGTCDYGDLGGGTWSAKKSDT